MADYNRRFERTAKNDHDAHRPLRGDEDLSRIFTWQEERRMSRNLVVHFKRTTYLVEPSPDPLRGPTASLLALRHEPLRRPGRGRGEQAPRRRAVGHPGFASGTGQSALGIEDAYASREGAHRGRSHRGGTFLTLQLRVAQRDELVPRAARGGAESATIEPRSVATLELTLASTAAPVDQRCPTGHFYLAEKRRALLGVDTPSA
jgi:hypothetical protein